MTKIHNSVSLCLFVILINIIPHSANETAPTIFILGDSTADVGTNTYLPGSTVRADFPHNGIDFPNSRPTGRFSNGFNSADFVAKFFGIKRSPPPFLFLLTLKPNHFRKHLLKGVNFASGGAGLLDITSSNLTVVPLSQQIIQFSTVRDNLTALIGPAATDTMLSKSLFFISIGSNDIFGYFMTNSTMPKDQYISILISAYSYHITNLYKLGARKFGIISVPPVGCCPSQRLIQKLINGVDGCFEPENDFALSFYTALDNLLLNISSQLPGFKYSLGNGYRMAIDVIENPHASGFENVDSACCGYGLLNAQGPCNSTASLCPDRRKYLFWDSFHPTKKAAYLAAQTLYNGPPYYVSPINFSQLAKDY
ncbi:Triacylglycerol lipase [Handroanthus impetiginosus]|uniref:Triacylglycerol lipase n=1 Tax=Handroanthus impetiginosus TaxID=429701 RepID=A0A2G9I7V3_9LAMI|nr:Triacylglycerol lipase [Handroanthus impetiginosus]